MKLLKVMARTVVGGMVGTMLIVGTINASKLLNPKTNLPEGDYQNSCQQCSFENNTLSCICTAGDGSLFRTSVPNIDLKCFENYRSYFFAENDNGILIPKCDMGGCYKACPTGQPTKTPYMSVIANYMVFQRCWAWSQGESIAESHEIPQQVLFADKKHIYLSSSKAWKVWCGSDAQHTSPVGDIPIGDANARKIVDVGGGAPGLRWGLNN